MLVKPLDRSLPVSYRSFISMLATRQLDRYLEEEVAFLQRKSGIRGLPGRKAALIAFCEGGRPIR